MTDRCAPPAEHANERWHWLKIHDNAVVRFWWPGDGWHQPLGNIGSNDMARAGYRYLRPCRPDDAEARERLEAENARLRAVADAAQEVATAVDCLETARTVPQQRQFTDEIIDAAKKLADALAALTPGDAS